MFRRLSILRRVVEWYFAIDFLMLVNVLIYTRQENKDISRRLVVSRTSYYMGKRDVLPSSSSPKSIVHLDRHIADPAGRQRSEKIS